MKKIILYTILLCSFNINVYADEEKNKPNEEEKINPASSIEIDKPSSEIIPPAIDKEKELAQTHNELRDILRTLVSSINSGKYEEMNEVLSKDIEATPINSEYLVGKEQVNNYFSKWFGEKGKLKSLNISMNADKLTWIHNSGDIGIVSGSGIEKYELKDGRTYDLKTRWTATVIKEEGKWKMRSFNSSVNFLDNPIINEIESSISKYSIISAITSLILGVGIGFSIGKKKNKA